MNKTILFLLFLILASVSYKLIISKMSINDSNNKNIALIENNIVNNPLSLQIMRSTSYPGSELQVEEVLSNGINYTSSIVSYLSEGLKIFALLNVPIGTKPDDGWPVIVFNHGYIAPEEYKTTERYVAYVNAFSKNRYIVIKPDYRGNGISEGDPEGAYYSAAYTTDVMNAMASVKKYPDANSNAIGMWGHSLGGNITLRSMEITTDIKAGVIWGGVVGSYNDLLNNWHSKVPYTPSPRQLRSRNQNRAEFIKLHGQPTEFSEFWKAIDPFYNVDFINAPIQLHTGLADEVVPPLFSENLEMVLLQKSKTVELYKYPGADHNLSSPAFESAMERSIVFFDKYLKP